MSRRPITVEDLWALPRVGSPVPAPDGRRAIVPVTTWSMDTNESTTRLWLVATAGARPEPPRALTAAESSSGQAALSPDGARLAFVRRPGPARSAAAAKTGPRYAEKPQLYVMPLDGGEAERLTDLPLGALDPRWFPDGRRIAFLSPVLIDAPTLEGTAELAKAREEDPVKAAVTENKLYRHWDQWLTEGKVHHIFAIDVATRAIVDLTPGSTRWFPFMEPADNYRIAPDGSEVAFTATRSEPPHDPLLFGVFTVPVPRTTGPTSIAADATLLTEAATGHCERPVYSPDGRFVIYGMQREYDFYADRERLVAYDRHSRDHRVLTETWDRSAGGWSFGADAGTLFLAAEAEARSALFALDLGSALRTETGAVPLELVRGGWFTDPRPAAGRLFTTRESLSAPPEVVSFAADGSDPRIHTDFTAAIMGGLRLGRVEETHFEGAGGRKVQMFLVHPPDAAANLEPASSPDSTKTGAAGKESPTFGASVSTPQSEGIPSPAENPQGLPLVQVVHGGPHAVTGDQWHWRWNAHLFAAPGYLAAIVNFHGSTSWGQEFAASILGRWGDQPYQDVMAATDTLIARGLADPKRMAAAGASYGGYLVAWIASQTDRFACIVNHAGVSDLQTQWGSDVTQGRRRAMGGAPWEKIEAMDRFNPLRHASGFRSPMLVIHGERDFRVPYVQGLEIYNVYKARKLPARLVVYPDENHWVLKPRNSRHWYGEVLGWLARWIGPGAGA